MRASTIGSILMLHNVLGWSIQPAQRSHRMAHAVPTRRTRSRLAKEALSAASLPDPTTAVEIETRTLDAGTRLRVWAISDLHADAPANLERCLGGWPMAHAQPDARRGAQLGLRSPPGKVHLHIR